MKILSLRDHPDTVWDFICYFQKQWAVPDCRMEYEDCMFHCLNTSLSASAVVSAQGRGKDGGMRSAWGIPISICVPIMSGIMKNTGFPV